MTVANLSLWSSLVWSSRQHCKYMKKRNKPAESWLARTKYELEHHEEILAAKLAQLKEIRQLKKKNSLSLLTMLK